MRQKCRAQPSRPKHGPGDHRLLGPSGPATRRTAACLFLRPGPRLPRPDRPDGLRPSGPAGCLCGPARGLPVDAGGLPAGLSPNEVVRMKERNAQMKRCVDMIVWINLRYEFAVEVRG